MSRLERIYDASPIFFQNIMCSIKGILNNKKRYGKEYWKYREFLEEFDTWPLEKQLQYQKKELIKLLDYVVNNSEFYKELYKDLDITDIREIKDLERLPIVDKEMLRINIDKVITIPRKGAVEGHTGGTTGKSLVVRSRTNDSMRRMAMLDHFKARVGFEHRKMRRATFNGQHIIPPTQNNKIFWRYNVACKQMIYSSFHLTEDNMATYVESLNKYKPQALDGFFTSMCDLAGYIERHGISLDFTPIAIFPTSETLTSNGRELLERVFKCRVYNQYASSEGAPFVTECKNQVLHVELASGIFEEYGDNGEVLVTSFTTYGTPLIRYRIGDCMIFTKDIKCNCGLKGPIVQEIQGRRLDYLYTPEGAKINAGNVANLLKNIPNVIIRAQFRQMSLNKIMMLLEVDSLLYTSQVEQLIRKEFLHKFGENMDVEIRVVPEIPREKSGKFRMIINKVEER